MTCMHDRVGPPGKGIKMHTELKHNRLQHVHCCLDELAKGHLSTRNWCEGSVRQSVSCGGSGSRYLGALIMLTSNAGRTAIHSRFFDWVYSSICPDSCSQKTVLRQVKLHGRGISAMKIRSRTYGDRWVRHFLAACACVHVHASVCGSCKYTSLYDISMLELQHQLTCSTETSPCAVAVLANDRIAC